MSDQSCPTLHGTRVQLRPVHQDDAQAMHALWSRPDFAGAAGGAAIPALETMRGAITAFEQMNQAGLYCKWTLTQLHSPLWIGECELHPVSPQVSPWSEWSLGFSLHPDHRGQGLMTEAVALAIDWLAAHRPAQRISADVAPGNTASTRLLSRLGFEREGLQRAKACVAGRPQDRELWARVIGPAAA